MTIYQPWSFWLAWAIIVGGFIATAVVVVLLERRDSRHRTEHDRWLSQQERDCRRREAWIKEICDAD